MAYKFQIGTFVTSGSIDISSGDIELNDDVIDNADLAGNISMDKMASVEDADIAFSGDAGKFVSSKAAKFNLDAEAALRVSGDSALQNSINAVQADVDQNELDADNAIAAEVSRATAAESGIQADVDANELDGDNDRAAIRSEFAAADTALQGNIDVETARIDAMLAGSGVDLDTLIEIVDAYELADTSIVSSITTLQADVDANELDGDNDRALIRSQFAAADTALSGAVAADFAALISDIGTLQADVDQNESDADAAIASEETARIAGDAALSTSITNLSSAVAADLASQESDFDADVAALQAEIDAEEVRAAAAEAALQVNITAEETARTAADTVLQNNINSLSGAVATDFTALIGDLQSEETARIAADGSATTDRAAIRSEFAAADSALSGAVAADFAAMQSDIDAAELEHQEDFASLFAVTSLTATGTASTAVNFVDATNGNVVVTVPDGATSGEYKRMKRKDATSNSATLSGKIEGNSSASVSMFDNAALMLVWDGAMWWIM